MNYTHNQKIVQITPTTFRNLGFNFQLNSKIILKNGISIIRENIGIFYKIRCMHGIKS